jgi:hypothetical protein
MKPQSPPIYKIIEFISQSFSDLGQTPRKLILGGLIFFFFMSASTTLLLGYYVYQPQVDAFFQKATHETSEEPASESTEHRSPELPQVQTQEDTDIIDIAFEDLIVSSDQQTLQVTLTITNLAASPLTITNGDLSLTGENKPPLNPLKVEPALPQGIPPGSSLSLKITFTHPGGTYAELRVFDTTLDLFY